MTADGIAVVGMACRLPGAASIAEMREALRDGRDRFTELSEQDLIAAGLSREDYEREGYVRRAPLLDDIAGFDAGFFGLSSAEAELMDPQHRLFLECVVEALEAGGIVPARDEGHIGIFAGTSISSYLLFNVLPGLQPGASARTLMAMVGNEKDYLASHTAYLLGLKGPAVGIQTACSSSLVAAHYAAQSLLSHECDMAIAGGVNVRVPHRVGYQYEPGSILSASGQCRSFDADADGTVFGSGAGAVVLCRLSDALRDGRHVHAVILGSAVNNDGSAKAGYTVPGLDGQVAVVAEALAASGLGPADIGYIESHGTGTPIGDPIEVRALGQVFGGHDLPEGRIALGTAKAIFGHLEAAAGIVGLMAAIVAIEDGRISALPHFSNPNPHLGLDRTPFGIAAQARDWPDDLPRRAAVSSFGIGGTNANVIVGPPPQASPGEVSADAARPLLYPVSAKSTAALAEAVGLHRAALREGEASFAAQARMAALGRDAYACRAAVVAKTAEEAAERLDACKFGEAKEPPRLAFVFSGQGGSSWPDLASLRSRFPHFRQMLDRAVERHPDLGPVLGGQQPADPADTANLQVALFALQAGLTETLRGFGISPAAVCGHSVGEIAAAWAAGMIGFDDALDFAAERGRLMAGLTGGAMATVLAGEADVREAGCSDIVIAAHNAPSNLVISGAADAIEQAVRHFESSGIEARRLPGQVAFHSPAIEAVAAQLRDAASEIAFRPASLPFVSTLTGGTLDQIDAEHWCEHATRPVAFHAAMESLAGSGFSAMVEIGPGAGLTALLRGNRDDLDVLPALGGTGDAAALLTALAGLFVQGCDLDWPALVEPGPRAALPHYPFQRRHCWVDPPTTTVRAGSPVFSVWPDRPQWLADHRVGGRIVMPAAGLVSFVLAASGNRTVGPMTFETLLEVDADGTELKLVPEAGGASAVMATGAGKAPRRIASVGRAPERCETVPMEFDESRLLHIEATSFYAGMASNGIELGPALQRLSDVRAGDGMAIAQIRLEDPEPHGFGAALHPAVLDGMFQVLAAAVGEMTISPHVPVSIDALRLERRMFPAGAYRCEARLRPPVPGSGLIVGDIRLVDGDSRTIAQVEGLASRPLDARDSAGGVDFLYEPAWIACPGHVLPAPAAVVADLNIPEMDAERHLAYLERVDRLASAFAAQAVASLVSGEPIEHLLALSPLQERYRPLARRYCTMLQEDGLAGADGMLRQPLPDPETLAQGLIDDYPDHAIETDLLIRCGQSLASILTGETDPLSILFQQSTQAAGELYGESNFARRLNHLLCDAVDHATDGQDHLRLLEIGGGTGGTTRHLLPRLDGRLADYLFTDISPGFLSAAIDRFGDNGNFRTKVFDVESSGERQEIKPGSFDIVVAANVLHAAGDIAEAAGHARDALAPGGWLVLMEGFAPSRWLDLTFGLTEGWWNRTDLSRRPDYPLMSAEAWRQLLAEDGFDDAQVLTLGPGRLAEQGIVLARKSSADSGNFAVISAGLEASSAGAAMLSALKPAFQPGARLLVPTCGAARIWPEDDPDVEQGAVTGLVKAAALEVPDAKVRLVDLDPHDPDKNAVLAREADIDDGEIRVAWRRGRRYAERLVPAGSVRRLPEAFQAVQRESDDRFDFAPLDRATPGPDEIEIAIHAAGLNFKDVLTVLGLVPKAGRAGGECAGIVTAVGENVEGLETGDRVVALAGGSFASHVIVPAERASRLPVGMSFAEAAAIPVAGMTAWHALKELAPIGPGWKVLIHTATGGVGHFAVALAQAAGAEIFATAGNRWKQDRLKAAGIRHVYSSRDTDFADDIRALVPEGIDLVVNTLSGDATLAGLGLLRDGGSFIELGRAGILSAEDVSIRFPDVNYHIVSLDQVDDATGGKLLAAALDMVVREGIPLPPLSVMPMADIDDAMQVMKRGDHVGKIVLTPRRPFAFRKESAYLITGGTGGIGMEVAGWAVDQGARFLHLTAHSAPGPGLERRIDKLRDTGASVRIHQVDLAEKAELERLLDAIEADGHPLAGLFHAAGRLDDSLLAGLTPAHLSSVAAPKSDAAAFFDARLPDLDAFVLFSSAAGVLGSAGQANHAAASAALDALAEARHGRGRHALSIDWGAWSEIGEAHRRGADRRSAESGVGSISPAAGLKALAAALDHPAPRLVALPLDLDRLRQSQAVAKPSIFSSLLAEQDVHAAQEPPEPVAPESGKPDAMTDLAGLPPVRRLEALAALVEDEARRLMSAGRAQISHQRPLQEIGLDSLMAIELRNRLGQLSEKTLPATLLFNYPAIANLASYLDTLVFSGQQEQPADQGSGAGTIVADDEELLILDEQELDRILSDMENRYLDKSE